MFVVELIYEHLKDVKRKVQQKKSSWVKKSIFKNW